MPLLLLFACLFLMPRRNKSAIEAGDEVMYTSERPLPPYTLVEEGKVSNLDVVRAPGTATVLEPRKDEPLLLVPACAPPFRQRSESLRPPSQSRLTKEVQS